MSEIRLLCQDDIPSLMRLNRAAGWNQTERDWARLMRLQPDGCFGLEAGGQVVATTTAYCYGRRLAWIGMVLTDPECRGRGCARRLMEHALAWLEGRGLAWIKLDATDMGRPLYLKLGFEDEAPVERWGLNPGGVAQASRPVSSTGALPFDLDRRAFGADRAALLEDLARGEQAVLSESACAMGRPGANAAFFGPCVSRSAEDARTLLQWFLGAHPGEPVYWDILPENREAVRLAEEFGFVRRRRLVRQVRRGAADAAPLVRADEYVFAIAGFEYG